MQANAAFSSGIPVQKMQLVEQNFSEILPNTLAISGVMETQC
jgi:hypothetical protein